MLTIEEMAAQYIHSAKILGSVLHLIDTTRAVDEHTICLEERLDTLEPNYDQATPLIRHTVDLSYPVTTLQWDRPGSISNGDSSGATALYEESSIQPSQADDPQAIYNLALTYHYGGSGVEKDPVRALELFETALKLQSSATTECALGVLLEEGAPGVLKDPPRALQLYEKAAEQGLSSAMYNLAKLLRHGDDGVPADVARAVELYEKAIKVDGHICATYNLAVIYWQGADGVPADPLAAVKLAESAVATDDADCKVLLAMFLESGCKDVPRNIKRATTLYDEAIEAGKAEAMYRRVLLARSGATGEDPTSEPIVHLIKRASEKDHVQCTYWLGELVLKGQDGPSRALRAKKLFEKAAACGHVDSMFSLAVLLEQGGKDLMKDLDQATSLFEHAADEGHSGAMNRLGMCYRDGRTVPTDAPKALKWFMKSAHDDANEDAIMNLAEMNLIGADGVESNVPMAMALLEHAYSRIGSVKAKSRTGMLLWSGLHGVAKDVPKAIGLVEKAVEEDGRPFDMMLLSRMLLSDEAGDLKDTKRGAAVMEQAFRQRAREPSGSGD